MSILLTFFQKIAADKKSLQINLIIAVDPSVSLLESNRNQFKFNRTGIKSDDKIEFESAIYHF